MRGRAAAYEREPVPIVVDTEQPVRFTLDDAPLASPVLPIPELAKGWHVLTAVIVGEQVEPTRAFFAVGWSWRCGSGMPIGSAVSTWPITQTMLAWLIAFDAVPLEAVPDAATWDVGEFIVRARRADGALVHGADATGAGLLVRLRLWAAAPAPVTSGRAPAARKRCHPRRDRKRDKGS